MSDGYFLRFVGLPQPHDMVGWVGEWPPPLQIFVARGDITGQYAYTEDRAALDRTLAKDRDKTIKVRTFERKSYSKIKPVPNVMRGAEYVEVR